MDIDNKVCTVTGKHKSSLAVTHDSLSREPVQNNHMTFGHTNYTNIHLQSHFLILLIN